MLLIYELQFIDGGDFEILVFEKHVSVPMDLEMYFKIIKKFNDSMTEEKLVALEYLFETENFEVEKCLKK